MMKIQKIREMMDDAEQEIREDAAKNITHDLGDFLKTATPEQQAGLRFAIEIIKENHGG